MYSPLIVFMSGLIIGVYFASIVIQIHNTKYEKSLQTRNSKYLLIKNDNSYDIWLSKTTNFTRLHVSNDDLIYGAHKYNLEATFLYEHVPILCAMKINRFKNAVAANNTWLNRCNEKLFYDSPQKNIRQTNNSHQFKNSVSSSWHLLCNTILYIRNNYTHKVKYVIFVNDNTFVIPENLRVILASFMGNDTFIYMGHAISFWGVTYNVAQSGFVLGMNVIERLAQMFKNNEECQKSGKYWKQEDWYLGKYLSSMNIYPINPNVLHSNKNLSRFHGHSLEQSMFPGSQKVLTKYYKNWIHPAECCSSETVTFNAVEADKIYQYNYLIYHLRLFTSGSFGLNPAFIPLTEEQVWRSAVQEYSNNLDPKGFISSQEYYKMWEMTLNNNSSAYTKLKANSRNNNKQNAEKNNLVL